METTKLTVRVPRRLLEEAKRYATEHDTTLTRLVSEYLRQLSAPDGLLAEAPAVYRLSGTLSPEASVEEYYRHIEEKHGFQA